MMKQGTSLRCACGKYRIHYDEFLCSWSDTKTSKPFLTFHNGTAGAAFETLSQAKRHLEHRCKWPLECEAK